MISRGSWNLAAEPVASTYPLLEPATRVLVTTPLYSEYLYNLGLNLEIE